MCALHCAPGMSRRGFATTLIGAGLALSSLRASAQADVPDTLCIMCIDHAFVADAMRFFNTRPNGPGAGLFDLVALAGASLAAKPDRRAGGAFRDTYLGLREQVLFAKQPAAARHPDVRKIVVLDHLGCGAYKDEFPGMQPGQEEARHREVAQAVRPWFAGQNLETHFWLIRARGQDPVRLL